MDRPFQILFILFLLHHRTLTPSADYSPEMLSPAAFSDDTFIADLPPPHPNLLRPLLAGDAFADGASCASSDKLPRCCKHVSSAFEKDGSAICRLCCFEKHCFLRRLFADGAACACFDELPHCCVSTAFENYGSAICRLCCFEKLYSESATLPPLGSISVFAISIELTDGVRGGRSENAAQDARDVELGLERTENAAQEGLERTENAAQEGLERTENDVARNPNPTGAVEAGQQRTQDPAQLAGDAEGRTPQVQDPAWVPWYVFIMALFLLNEASAIVPNRNQRVLLRLAQGMLAIFLMRVISSILKIFRQY